MKWSETVSNFALFITLLLSFAWGIDSTVISNSQLERCVLNGTVSDGHVNNVVCEEKLVVTIAIEGGRELETESLKFDLTCIGSTTCPCPCDYASQADCTCRDLNQSVVLGLTKTPVFASYALTYIQAFNSKPKEVVHSGLSSCKDGDFSDSPTCGWYLLGGERVDDSQGFCCECTSGQVLSDTFGSLDERTRANLNCDFFDDAWDFFSSNPSSAHCLYLDPLWYQGFEMDTANIEFEISVEMRNEGTGTNETLTLSPSEPIKINVNKTMEVELLGDFASYTQLPDLGAKMLMIPYPPGSDPATALSSSQEQWMLIDKTQTSLDGSECNKVGTSFTAFRFQSDGCSRPVGTCLDNQLQDKYNEDLDRASSGQTPLYLLSRYSKSSSISTGTSSSRSGSVNLKFPVHGIRNSVVTLTAAADHLQFVVHSSPGQILGAEVCAFNNATCGVFEALTDRGYLQVQIQNTGVIASEYTITVGNCSEGVLPITAQRTTLAPQEFRQLPAFLVQMTTATARQNLTCWVTLRSSLGEELDSRNVSFSVSHTQFTETPENPGFKEGTGAAPEPQSLSCSDYCPSIFDLPCILVKRCWTRLLIILAIVFSIFIAGSLLVKAIRRGWFAKCCVGWIGFVWSGSECKATPSNKQMDIGPRQEETTVKKRKVWDSAEEQFHSTPIKMQDPQMPMPSMIRRGYNEDIVYVDLTALGPPSPGWLRSPGPSYCLAGCITKIQSIPKTDPCHLFIIPEGLNFQRKAWSHQHRCYVQVPRPIPFNPSLATMTLDSYLHSKLISRTPRGTCLN